MTEKKKWAEVRRHIEAPDAFDKHDSTAVKMLYNRWLLDFERAGGPGERVKDVFDDSAAPAEKLDSLATAAQIKFEEKAKSVSAESDEYDDLACLSLSVDATVDMRRRANYQFAKDNYEMRRIADTLIRVDKMLENGDEDARANLSGKVAPRQSDDVSANENLGWELELDGSDSADAEDDFGSTVDARWDSDDEMADKVCEVCRCGGHEEEVDSPS